MDNNSAVYRSATITASTTDDGVKFSISAGSGEYAVKYDEDREQYYLDRGEAIVFGYLADIGTAQNTTNSAVNTIAMAYIDHLGNWYILFNSGKNQSSFLMNISSSAAKRPKPQNITDFSLNI